MSDLPKLDTPEAVQAWAQLDWRANAEFSRQATYIAECVRARENIVRAMSDLADGIRDKEAAQHRIPREVQLRIDENERLRGIIEDYAKRFDPENGYCRFHDALSEMRGGKVE